MKILTTLFPVFFMMALGFVSRIKKWLTPDQKEGAKKLVFGILFPILIFNAIFTSSLSASTGIVILYVTAAFLAVYLLGRLLLKNSKDQYDELIPFLLTTCEGGNVALPLYTTIVGAGYAINTVTFDMAGVILAFVIVPAIVTARTSGSADMKSMLKKICTNSFVVSSVLGLVMNLTGMYHVLEQSAFLELYTGTVSMILAPIAGVILFTIGYDLNADTAMIRPIMKTCGLRILSGILIILGFYLLFPSLLADKIYRTAVILYFMSPTGFALPMQLQPLCRDESGMAFMSSYISVYMMVTLAVYVGLVITY